MTQASMKAAIQSVISEMMDKIMDRVLYEDPFIREKHHARKPLYAALVPDEIFQGSHFERRFVTPFGKTWEKLAVVAATEGLGYGVMGHEINGVVKSGRLARIIEVLNRLEHRQKGSEQRVRPDWNNELAYIRQGRGEDIPVTVICDVFTENTETGGKYAFELKAPLPNSDQTKVSKEKIFKLYCMDPPQIQEAYYALPYNPYGERENYSWSFPARWFNMKEDAVVRYWRKGCVGSYEQTKPVYTRPGLVRRVSGAFFLVAGLGKNNALSQNVRWLKQLLSPNPGRMSLVASSLDPSEYDRRGSFPHRGG